jgi:hypothetical protein
MSVHLLRKKNHGSAKHIYPVFYKEIFIFIVNTPILWTSKVLLTKEISKLCCIFATTYIHMHVCIYEYIYVYIYVCVNIYICIYVCVCVCIYIYIAVISGNTPWEFYKS